MSDEDRGSSVSEIVRGRVPWLAINLVTAFTASRVIGQFEGGAQIVVGARTTALDELKLLGRPRVHLLAGVNTAGGTNAMKIVQVVGEP